MKKFLFALMFLFLSAAGASARDGARFIFFFIGDGMGQNQYQAANERGLTKNIDALPVRGKISTNSQSGVTDSAAAGTALATGFKTKNGVLGISDGSPRESVLEKAKKMGMKVGIISTMTMNHATPAAFYAKIDSRNEYYSIGLQLIKSNFDYFGGGGFTHDRGKNKDKESLLALAKKAGYKISVNPALRSDACMHYVESRPKNARKLSEFVQEAIQIFSDNKNGFIIMIEGGNIDYACHDHEFERAMLEISDFNDSLAPALEFYKKNPNETLIIVTADHETGGLSLNPIKWSTKGHSGTDVPIFANISLANVKDNTDVAKLIFKELER